MTCALLRDFSKHGEKAIAKVRQTHPAAYLKICTLLVLREKKLEQSGSAIKAMTDETPTPQGQGLIRNTGFAGGLRPEN